MNEVLRDKLANYSKALRRLEEAQSEKGYALSLDGTIQRFEFTFETSWKALRKFLLIEGYDCASARDCIKKAFQSRYVDHEEAWLNMLKDRNASSHLYDEAEARKIYERVAADYLPEFRKLEKVLSGKAETL